MRANAGESALCVEDEEVEEEVATFLVVVVMVVVSVLPSAARCSEWREKAEEGGGRGRCGERRPRRKMGGSRNTMMLGRGRLSGVRMMQAPVELGWGGLGGKGRGGGWEGRGGVEGASRIKADSEREEVCVRSIEALGAEQLPWCFGYFWATVNSLRFSFSFLGFVSTRV